MWRIAVALCLGACGSHGGNPSDGSAGDASLDCSPIGTLAGTAGGYTFAPLTTATALFHAGAGLCDPFMNCGTVDISDGVAMLKLHFYGNASPWTAVTATLAPPGQSLSSILGSTLTGGGMSPCQSWTMHLVFASGTLDGSVVAATTTY